MISLVCTIQYLLQEDTKYCARENQTNHHIQKQICALLNRIDDDIIRELMKHQYEKEVRGKRKEVFIHMYNTIQDVFLGTHYSRCVPRK